MAFPLIDPLTTLATCKAVLGVTDTTEDTALNFYIQAASSQITESCNRTHFLASNAANPITEYYSGLGTEWLVLNQWPVQSITSIFVDDNAYWGQASGSFASTTELVQGTDYALRLDALGQASASAMVLRINNVWDCRFQRDGEMLSAYTVGGMGNIQVMYTVGFQTLPSDLTLAATMLVARIRNSFPFGTALSSEHFEEYSYVLKPQFVDKMLGMLGGEIGVILAKYRVMAL